MTSPSVVVAVIVLSLGVTAPAIAAKPRLGVVDTTQAGAPDIAAAIADAAAKAGKFDVQAADAVDAAVVEARRMGAACGFDDGPECWARLGVLSELDRIAVLRVDADRLDLLLVDVPARTAARSSATIGIAGQEGATIDDVKKAAGDALAALLSGQPTKAAPPKAKPKGPLFTTGVYTTAFSAVLLAGCGGGALGVSSQMASKLAAARDDGVALDDGYRALDAGFVGLSICAVAATATTIGGAVLLAVAE